jgi:hypothetical protein
LLWLCWQSVWLSLKHPLVFVVPCAHYVDTGPVPTRPQSPFKALHSLSFGKFRVEGSEGTDREKVNRKGIGKVGHDEGNFERPLCLPKGFSLYNE